MDIPPSSIACVSTSQARVPYPLLPPDEAYALLSRNLVVVATVAIWIWDFLLSLPGDYQLHKSHAITPPCMVYLVSRIPLPSRIATLGLCIYSVVYAVHPIGNCEDNDLAMGAITVPAYASCTLLVLLRVRATFHGSPHFIYTYSIFWLAHLAFTTAAYFALRHPVSSISGTGFCSPSRVNYLYTASATFLCLYHTAMVVGVSLRMASMADKTGATEERRAARLRNAILGSHLPSFSRGMLRNTQIYCMATLVFGILCVVWSHVHQHSPYYGSLFTLPSVAIMNIMACRVYRNTKPDGV
ncbi:hypothetical protein CC2G_012620 [Coprinopsis cinerea AmutBmut pab1-1]|nr:hypothetical protein CC2G_012620 [Coprinopsis cinerea AmutBmut pab1-1]